MVLHWCCLWQRVWGSCPSHDPVIQLVPPISPHPPTFPSPLTPTSGAIIELTGEAPKIVFGSLDSPVCDLKLNRATGSLESSCTITTPAMDGERRLSDFDGARYHAVKSELQKLREDVVQLRRIARDLTTHE